MTTTSVSTRHLLGLREISRERLVGLLESAASLLPIVTGEVCPRDTLDGRIIANLFLENSTRTRVSFTVAARRLGGTTVDLIGSSSSASKGESLIDTARNVAAMGVDAVVVRCAASGGAHLVARHVDCPVINAGDGTCEHPTQGLLDALALTRAVGSMDLTDRTVGVTGDIAHSRVARSAVFAMTSLGADVVLIGPPSMTPASLGGLLDGLDDTGRGTVSVCHDLDAVLPILDAAMMLRVQFERGAAITSDYASMYGMTERRAAKLPDGAFIMHPGPINRGLELAAETADGPRSIILDQVTSGVAVRMAVLLEQLGSHI
ncbi:MAG: aspartate carbamoyltransferase catalytic subunit [Planctomycetes bacterium]|jgi:aspartate carbamoyltransferase catalytic subunit|nr:aspartate carbamoyltransferase catalytic subunit [Planctomycetota bacterium]MCP4838430.1 aspartate carbamoyltransferase catalytic subunit [Planctomycetota bacterium]